jgi:hypothetical protein
VPIYFFDIDDGDASTRDEEGLELPDEAAARVAGLACLGEIASEKIVQRDQLTMTLQIRRADRSILYEARLRLSGEFKQPERNRS